MSSKLLINVNDATPTVVPDTSAPDTGMFSVSHTDGANNIVGMILPIIGVAILVIAMLAIIIAATKKRKKVNRFTTHTNKHLVAKLTTLSVVVLLGILGVLNIDKITSMVSAVTDTSGDDDTLTITASDIKIDVDLNDKAVFATGESVVTVDSATEAGYTLMAYVDSTATDLKNETNKSSKSTITMLDANLKTPKGLEDNTWGMSVTKATSQQDEVFRGLPTTLDEAVTLKYTEEATTANDKTTVYFGTYITPDLDYGTYSGVTITYVAIANVIDICNPNATTIQEAVCLQDFAGPNRDQIVDSMTPETQYTLMDKRDEKTYTIAKLYARKNSGSSSGGGGDLPILTQTVDNNTTFQVWMTQNLDLDLDSNTTYTNKDTDLGYNPDAQQYETASWTPRTSTYTNQGVWRESNTTPESYNPGDVYWNGTIDYNHESSGGSFISSSGIPQYHLGNYYNWTAAIAMNDSSSYIYRELVEQSICPAGWTLPRASFGDDTFYSLWGNYGFSEYSHWINEETGEEEALWNNPLSFIPAGGYTGALEGVGYFGYFWSAVIYAESEAFSAGYDYSYLNASYNDYRYYGNSIRCIARPVADSIEIVPPE